MKTFDFEIVVEEPTRITNAEGAAAAVRQEIGDDISKQEHLVVIALDGASNIIYCKSISKGTLTQSLVHPREVFADAIVERAASVIVAHNHPSGTMEPSRADDRITDRLREAGRILGIELLDHVIVTPHGGYYSYADEARI